MPDDPEKRYSQRSEELFIPFTVKELFQDIKQDLHELRSVVFVRIDKLEIQHKEEYNELRARINHLESQRDVAKGILITAVGLSMVASSGISYIVTNLIGA